MKYLRIFGFLTLMMAGSAVGAPITQWVGFGSESAAEGIVAPIQLTDTSISFTTGVFSIGYCDPPNAECSGPVTFTGANSLLVLDQSAGHVFDFGDLSFTTFAGWGMGGEDPAGLRNIVLWGLWESTNGANHGTLRLDFYTNIDPGYSSFIGTGITHAPEPSAMALMGLGLLAVGTAGRRLRRK